MFDFKKTINNKKETIIINKIIEKADTKKHEKPIKTYLFFYLTSIILFITLIKKCHFVNDNIILSSVIFLVLNILFCVIICAASPNKVDNLLTYSNKIFTLVLLVYSIYYLDRTENAFDFNEFIKSLNINFYIAYLFLLSLNQFCSLITFYHKIKNAS